MIPDAADRPITARTAAVSIRTGSVALDGVLTIPEHAGGMVLFVHGSGSSRFSPRNRRVAGVLEAGGLGTLLFDLLTRREQQIDELTAALRFDIDLLTQRLIGAIVWLGGWPEAGGLRIGLFGASTGAAAALAAAAERPEQVAAVVSRGGRPDLVLPVLPRVRAPTLLIVGGLDQSVIGMNRRAASALGCEHRLDIIPGATHLFEEPGTLDRVACLARDWFLEHLQA